MIFLVYGAPLALVWFVVLWLRAHRERKALAQKHEAHTAGLTQPASLHPVIDPSMCIGCGACVRACPEGQILGLVNGKAELLEPANCIGHGACANACPMDAISLVFGTAERGVDIPHVGSDFQTNVPGIYIAGELGGMGLIRNAIEQGRQAVAEIAKRKSFANKSDADLIIIGAGPAGFAAGLAAKESGLRHVILEQETLGGTVSHFPRGKLVMTAPVTLPIYGKANFRETTKEALLEFWTKVAKDTGLEINFEERVTDITSDGSSFVVTTTKGAHRASAVLLTIDGAAHRASLAWKARNSAKSFTGSTIPINTRAKRCLLSAGVTAQSRLRQASPSCLIPMSPCPIEAPHFRGSSRRTARSWKQRRLTDV